MQRIALIRHSLHAASRTSDFTFFKTLQAHAFLDGTDHVAILSGLMGDEVDQVLHTLDDLNAGLAYVHQDAFKAIYDGIRTSIADEDHSRRAKIRVDVSQQKQVADFGIDKMANAAVALIESQDVNCQEAVANVWLFGATIIADAVQASIIQMDRLEGMMDDFILLEYGWQMVQTAVEASVSALRGVFNLMASSESGSSLLRTDRVGSNQSAHSRNLSVSSATGSLFRRLSTALSHPQVPPPPPSSTRTSFSMESPAHIRQSISHSFPTNVPISKPEYQRRLSTIPPTPFEVNVNPFDTNFQRYDFTSVSHHDTELTFPSGAQGVPYSVDEDMIESPSPLDVDPLSSAVVTPACDTYDANPTFFRRLSRDMGLRAIAV